MTRVQFDEIFSHDSKSWEGDNFFQGLLIISNYFDYTNQSLITGASKDIVFSISVDEMIEKGLTEHHAQILRDLNWMVEYGCLACFV